MTRLLSFALVAALLGSSARADSPPDAAAALAESLGRPARESAVRALVASPLAARGERGLAIAAALVDAGGVAAQRGLATLLDRGDEGVALAACKAIRTNGIRAREALAAVLARAGSADAGLRAAACEALGTIGSGRAVSVLVERLSDAAPEVARAAQHGLARLAGTDLGSSPARWTWWRETELPRARGRLREALDALASAPARRESDVEGAVVVRWGWLELEETTDVVRAWTRSTRVALQIHALRVSAALRLGDLDADLRSLVVYTEDADTWNAGVGTTTVLGIPMEGVLPPRSVRDRLSAPPSDASATKGAGS